MDRQVLKLSADSIVYLLIESKCDGQGFMISCAGYYRYADGYKIHEKNILENT